MRPVWLLDIDGVVNIFPRGRSGFAWPNVDQFSIVGDGIAYPFTVHPQLLAEIRRLVAEYDVDLRLCSTWVVDSENLLKALDLDIPHAFECAAYEPVSALKVKAASDLLQAGTPVIWSDDEAVPRGFAEHAAQWGTPLLLHQPDDGVGLTPADIKRAEEFLREVAA